MAVELIAVSADIGVFAELVANNPHNLMRPTFSAGRMYNLSRRNRLTANLTVRHYPSSPILRFP